MKLRLTVLLVCATAVLGCNRTDVEDDEEPPVNVVRPETIVKDTGSLATPLTNLPAAGTNR